MDAPHPDVPRDPSGRRGDRIPLAALSGLAVIAVVVSVSMASVGFGFFDIAPDRVDGEDPSGGAADASTNADPTPMTVQAGTVAWIDGANGAFAYNDSAVDQVCPPRDPDCATLKGSAGRQVAELSSAPRSVIRSSVAGKAIIEVDDGASGGQQLIVVALPEPTGGDATATPDESPDATASTAPVSSPSPAAATPTPDPSAEASPTASNPTASVEPSGPPASVEPSADPDPSSSPSSEPSVEPSDPADPEHRPVAVTRAHDRRVAGHRQRGRARR